MKMNKLIFPLMLSLAAVLAGSGCKKGITRITPLPGPPQPIVGEPQPTVPPYGGQLPPPENPGGIGVGGGPIATSSEWDPANCAQDHAALAANTVHFKFDSAVVQDSEQSNISAVAAALTSDPSVKLLIE